MCLHMHAPVCVSELIALDFINLCSVVMISSLRHARGHLTDTHTHTHNDESGQLSSRPEIQPITWKQKEMVPVTQHTDALFHTSKASIH